MVLLIDFGLTDLSRKTINAANDGISPCPLNPFHLLDNRVGQLALVDQIFVPFVTFLPLSACHKT
jgi:hypothetical protein